MKASVLVEVSHISIDKPFSYVVPDNLMDEIKIGKRVTVPFNNRVLEGFVIGLDKLDTDEELKTIIDVVDEDIVLTDELLELGKIISKKYLSTLISAYQVMLPKALKARKNTKINKKMDKYIVLNINLDDINNYKFNDKQLEIINLLTSGKVLKNILNNISKSSVNTLLKKEIIKELEVEHYRLEDNDSGDYPVHELNTEQQKVVDEVIGCRELPKTFLLHGVTGSGKTEVYMAIIDEVLKRGKTAIVLVPEISLTPQMVNRFKSRFKNNIAILHSRLSDGEKYDEYRKISREEVDIVIGARSAVFAPLKNIGTIIIDEEHTSTYKQENNPKYSAIDIAIIRSKYHHCSVVLGSATPSLESYAKSIKGVYKLLELKSRANNRALPKVEIIDMNKEGKIKGHFSKRLIEEIDTRLERGEQIILLLNRRGYASFITCSNCGYVEKCPNCDITLTYHKTSNTLRCHYCGYGTSKKEICPVCHEKSMKDLGLGTEKIEEELNELFNAKIIRMDFDTTSKKGSHEKIISAFREHKYDILLGTQMIAKGLDFDNVTLVGVINADTSLLIPSFRSSENTFQLLNQVSGRSGRGKKEGSVIIQTNNKDHYAIEYASSHDYLSFFKKEMSIRRELSYPPYFYLVNIKVISKDYTKARDESSKIGKILKENLTSSIILGPSISNVFKLNNEYRFNIIIKYKKEDNLYNMLTKLQNHYKNNKYIKIDIDFNPYNI